MRSSCAVISAGVKPSARSRPARRDVVRSTTRRSRSRDPRSPAARSAPLHVVGAQLVRPARLVVAGVVVGGLGPVVGRPRPDLRGQRGNAAAQRRVVDEGRPAAIEQHPAGGGQRRLAGRRDRRPHHLAVRGVAEVVALGAMAVAVGGGEGADDDGQRFVRGAAGARLPFAGDDARHVLLDGDRLDPHPSVRAGDADAQRAALARLAQRLVGDRRNRRGDRRRRRRTLGRRQRRSGVGGCGIALDRRLDAWWRSGVAASRPPATSAASMPAPPGATTTAARVGAPAGAKATTRPSDRPPGIGDVPVLASASARRRPSALAEPYSTAPRMPVAQQRPRRRPAGRRRSGPTPSHPGHRAQQRARRGRRPGQPDARPRPTAWCRQSPRARPAAARRSAPRAAGAPGQLHEEVVAGVGQRFGRATAAASGRDASRRSGGRRRSPRGGTCATSARVTRPRSAGGGQREHLGHRPRQHRRVEDCGCPARTRRGPTATRAPAPPSSGGPRVTGAWPAATDGPARSRPPARPAPHGGASRGLRAWSCSRACSDMGWSCRPRCCSRRSVRRPARCAWPPGSRSSWSSARPRCSSWACTSG